MNAPLYRLESLSFVYPGGTSAFDLRLDSLRIEPGAILALVGPNGAGKTTLLMLLAFLLRQSAGRIEFLGRDPWADGAEAVAARRQAVLVSHHPYLFKGTIGDNVAFGLRIRGLSEPERAERVREALSLVDLPGWETRPAAGLSTGQIQRVALARALALQPRALLLDEPTSGVETPLGRRLESALRELSRSRGTAIVFATHNLSQASRLADDVLGLAAGRRVDPYLADPFGARLGIDDRWPWADPRPGIAE